MKRAIVLAVAVMLAGTAAVAATYEWNKPTSGDPLDDTLRQYHFRGIHPPSNLLTVGSLYYVDRAGDYHAICNAERSDLEGQVMVSRTWDLEERLKQNGRFSTGVTIDLRAALKGDMESGYMQTVHASLTEVVLEEIPLAANQRIMAKLMQDPYCNKEVTHYVEAGKYVCQGHQTLQATVEFKLGRDVESTLEIDGRTASEIKHLIKQAVESQAHENVVVREDRLFSGSALKFGIQVNPTCLSPKTARFERSLPDTTFDRMVNFVLFSMVEPLFPAAATEVAQHSDATRMAGL
jgi:hypothetical protein